MKRFDRVRNILNILFLIGTLVTVALYIAENSMFFYTGFTALAIKVIDFILRFIN